jgi:hypothetical protein
MPRFIGSAASAFPVRGNFAHGWLPPSQLLNGNRNLAPRWRWRVHREADIPAKALSCPHCDEPHLLGTFRLGWGTPARVILPLCRLIGSNQSSPAPFRRRKISTGRSAAMMLLRSARRPMTRTHKHWRRALAHAIKSGPRPSERSSFDEMKGVLGEMV